MFISSPNHLPYIPALLAAAALSCLVPNPLAVHESDEAPTCGDGHLDADEACDLGPDSRDDGPCTSACAVASCGDSLFHAGVEECDPLWQLDGTQHWMWTNHGNGGFVEATLAPPQWAQLNLEFKLFKDGVLWFDEHIRHEDPGEVVTLTLYIDGELLLPDGTNTATYQRHEFPLSAGLHTFTWSATATTGDGSVRLDNVYIGPQTP